MKSSHVNIMKAKYQKSTTKVLQDTRMTPNQYHDLWLDAGLQFIEELCECPEVGLFVYRDQITTDRRYWQWLKNEWNRLEYQYLETFGFRRIDTDHYLNNMKHKLQTELKISFYEQYLPKLNQ